MKKSFIALLASAFVLASCSVESVDETPYYTVYHYFENIDDDEYTLDSQLTQKFKGEMNKETAAEALSVEGFIPQEFEQITIKKKKSSVSIYYNRVVSTLTFNGNGGILTRTNDEGEEEKLEQVVISGKYGTPVAAPDFLRNGFTLKSWDIEMPETIPAGDMELTALWKAEITNSTYRYYVRPLQTFSYLKGGIIQNVCWDYCGGLFEGNQLIIWIKKELSGSSNNQIFSFKSVEDKENTYYIFSNSTQNLFYLSENTQTHGTYDSTAKTSTTVSIDGLCAFTDSSKALQFELVPAVSSKKPGEELYAIKVSGTERYITTGPSMYDYYTNPSFITGSGNYEPFLIFDSLRKDEDGNMDDTQLFYLDDVKE